MREAVVASYQPRWVQLKEMNPTMIKENLHRLILEDAKDEIFHCMRKAVINRDDKICFIHGYNHGTVIRDYIDSIEFRQDCKKEGFRISRVFRYTNPGDTIIKIKLPQIFNSPKKVKGNSNWEKLKRLGKIRLNG